MPIPAHLIVFGPNKKPLAGPLPLRDIEITEGLTGSEIHEFIHRVYTIKKDYFYSLLYGIDSIRRHEPLRITKPIDKLSIPLLGYLIKGTFLPQVEIRWYEYDDKTRKEIEYFRMTLEHVRLNSIQTILPDAKDPERERYGHLETVSLCYQKITWLYKKGYRLYTDIWNGGFFDELDEKNFAEQKEDVEEAIASAAERLITLFKVTFTKGVFIKPEKGFSFDKKADVRFASTVNRKPDLREGKVFAKLYAIYNGKTEDMHQIQEGRLREDGTWETEFTLRKPQSLGNDKNCKPGEQVEYYAEIENKYADGNFKSESIMLPEKEEEIVVPWFIDVHAHINAPKAAPLPTIWVQLLLTKLIKPSWKFMENVIVKALLSLFKHDLPEFVSKDTAELGTLLNAEREKVLKDKELDPVMGPAENRDALQILMPMDMELGCYDGYEGKTIYQQGEDGKPGYWCYEKEGKRVWRTIKKSEVEKIEDLKKQIKKTNSVFRQFLGKMVPFFPYDPRRWNYANLSTYCGPWQQPFNHLIQVGKDLKLLKQYCSIGFKLYTALGFRPDDYQPREVRSRAEPMQRKKMDAKLPDLRNFYEACQHNKIPIICHGSQGGVFAHDYALFYDYLFPADGASDEDKMDFYWEVFVSPFAWEPVLRNFPDLYLCLAHFGGEMEWEKDINAPENWVKKLVELMEKYENFYVDLSYFIFDKKDKEKKFKQLIEAHPKIKRKLLFGTDWYLIGSEKARFGKYDHYVKAMFRSLKEADKELPAYLTVINPKKFLNIESVAEKLFAQFGSDCDIREFVGKLPDTIEQFKQSGRKK